MLDDDEDESIESLKESKFPFLHTGTTTYIRVSTNEETILNRNSLSSFEQANLGQILPSDA